MKIAVTEVSWCVAAARCCLANEPDSSFVLTPRSESSHCCTAVQPNKRVSGGFISRSHQSDNKRFRSKISLVGCPPGFSVICLGCKANAKRRPPSPFTKDLIQRDFLKKVLKLRPAPHLATWTQPETVCAKYKSTSVSSALRFRKSAAGGERCLFEEQM